MATLAERILMSIQVQVIGQQQVTNLTAQTSNLNTATQQLNTTYRDAQGRLRNMQGQFATAAQGAGAMGGAALGAAGSFGRLSLGLTGLNSGLQIVQQITGAVRGLLDQMTAYADEANRANTSTAVFDLTLKRFGVSTDEATGAAERLASRFGLAVSDVQDSMTTLIRVGFRDMKQLEQVMTGAAASAIAFGRSAEDGFARIADAAATGLSMPLNSIGIAENLGPAFKKYADQLVKLPDELNEVERAQALANLVFKATGTEVDALSTIQNDYVRSTQENRLAQTQLRREMGEVFMPVIVRFNRAGAEVVGTLNEMLKAYRSGGDGLKVLTDKYPVLNRVLAQVKPAADQMKGGLLDAWQGIQGFSERVLFPVLERILPIAQQVWSQVPGIVNAGARAVGEAFRLISDLWERYGRPTWDALAPIVSAAISGVSAVLRGAFDFLRGIFTAVRALIAGDWQGAWNNARDAVGRALQGVQTLLDGLLPKIGEALLNAGRAALERARTIGENIRDGIISGLGNLAANLADKLASAVEEAVSRLPDWARKLIGVDGKIEGLRGYASQTRQNVAPAGAAITARGAAAGKNGVLAALEDLPDGSFNLAVAQQAFMRRGDKFADGFVDYCLRWVRDNLGDAAPQFRAQIDKLFQGGVGKGQVPTAVTAYNNLSRAGLTRKYSTFADLKPGDSVFYTDGGQNHVGTYIGAGQVRGNNRVSFAQSGGKDPVGTVGINQLGRVTGYVAAADLMAYLQRQQGGTGPTVAAPALPKTSTTPAPTVTNPPKNDGPITSAQIVKAQGLVAALEKAKKALDLDPKNVGLIKAFDAADQAVKKWTKNNDSNARALAAVQAGAKKAADGYVATTTDLAKYGTQALLLIKEQERASRSGSAAEIERVRAKVEGFQKAGDAQAAVYRAEETAYRARQQADDKDKARVKEQAQLRARVADERRQLTVSAAQAELDRTQELNRQELDVFKGSAAARLALVKRQAEDEYQARLGVARATRDKELRESANADPYGRDPNRTERDRQINGRYADTELAARGTRDAAGRQAREEIARESEAVRDLTARYAELRKGLKARADAGTLSASDLADYGEQLAAYWDEAGKAGLKSIPAIRAAHDAAKTFGVMALDLNGAAIQTQAAVGEFDGLSDAGGRLSAIQNKVQASLADVLALLPESQDEWGSFVKVMEELDGKGSLAVGVLDGLRQKMDDLLAAQQALAGEAAGAQALAEILANPVGERTGRTDTAGQAQAETANNLRLALLDLNPVVLQNADTMQFWSDMLTNAAKSGGVNAEQAEGLTTVFGLLGTAATLLPDDLDTFRLALRAALSDGKLTKEELSDLNEQLRLFGGNAKDSAASYAEFADVLDGGSRKAPTQVVGGPDASAEEIVRAQAAETQRLSTLIGQTENLKDQADLWQSIIQGEVESAGITATQAKTLQKVLDLTLQLQETQRESDRLSATDAALAPSTGRYASLLEGFQAGTVGTAQLQTGLRGVQAELQALADAGDETALSLILGIDNTIAATRQLEDAFAEGRGQQLEARNREAVRRNDFRAQRQYLADRERLTVEAAQRTFDRETEQMDENLPEYKLAQQRLENARFQAAQDGEQARRALMESQINTFGNYMQQAIPGIAAAFQVLGGASDEVAAAWGESLSSMTNDVVNFATALARGDYIGAAIGALTSIFTGLQRQAQAARAELKKTAEYNEQFRFNKDGYGTRTVTEQTSGFLWWQKTTYTEDIDKVGRDLALGIEGAVASGFQNGFQEAVASGDSSAVEKALYSSLKGVALQALTDGFLNSASVVAVFGPLVQRLMEAFRTGNRDTINAAVSEFKAGVQSLQPEIEATVVAGREISAALGDAGAAGTEAVTSWRQALTGGVDALLSGESPLDRLYSGVRDRIVQAIKDGFVVKQILSRLDPLFQQLDTALSRGLDPSALIAQIGAALPGLSVELQSGLGPIFAALNQSIPNLTAAVNANTAAVKESQFQTTTIVSYGDVQGGGRMRQRLGGMS